MAFGNAAILRWRRFCFGLCRVGKAKRAHHLSRASETIIALDCTLRFAPPYRYGDTDADRKLPLRRRCLRSRRAPGHHRALPLPDLPQDARIGLLHRHQRPARPLSLDQGRRLAARLRIPRPAKRAISARNADRTSSPRARARTRSCCGWAASTRRSQNGPKCTSGDRIPPTGTTRRPNCRSGRKARPPKA